MFEELRGRCDWSTSQAAARLHGALGPVTGSSRFCRVLSRALTAQAPVDDLVMSDLLAALFSAYHFYIINSNTYEE